MACFFSVVVVMWFFLVLFCNLWMFFEELVYFLIGMMFFVISLLYAPAPILIPIPCAIVSAFETTLVLHFFFQLSFYQTQVWVLYYWDIISI